MGARASVLSGGELDKWEKIRLRPGGKKQYKLKHIVWASRELERFAVNSGLVETSEGCRQILSQLQCCIKAAAFCLYWVSLVRPDQSLGALWLTREPTA
nr:gag protein [Human immunodeficiency virus 1]